jgi:hypothetical protein
VRIRANATVKRSEVMSGKYKTAVVCISAHCAEKCANRFLDLFRNFLKLIWGEVGALHCVGYLYILDLINIRKKGHIKMMHCHITIF